MADKGIDDKLDELLAGAPEKQLKEMDAKISSWLSSQLMTSTVPAADPGPLTAEKLRDIIKGAAIRPAPIMPYIHTLKCNARMLADARLLREKMSGPSFSSLLGIDILIDSAIPDKTIVGLNSKGDVVLVIGPGADEARAIARSKLHRPWYDAI